MLAGWRISVAATLVLTGCFFYRDRDDEPDARGVDARTDAPLPDAPIEVPCPPSYTRDTQTRSCYRVFDAGGPQGWLLAEATCELDTSEGIPAHLAVVDDAVEGTRLLALTGGSGFWIGLSDHRVEGTFAAVNGAGPGAQQWAAAEPDNAANREDCVAYLPSATGWSDRPCSEALRIVCEHDGRAPAAPATYCDTDAPTDCGTCDHACGGDPCVAQVCVPPPPTCPIGYVQSTDAAIGTCHKLVSTPATWQAAEADCENDTFMGIGAHLVVIESAGERAYAQNLALGSFWIGASDHAVEGTFRWTTGAPVGFGDWATGEPNDDFNLEDCAEYRSASSLRNDRQCSINQRYVCEWDGTPPAATPTWCDTDLATDCGACGNACPAGQSCDAQYCLGACPPGYTGAIGSCYRLGTSAPATWQAAEAGCEADTFMSAGAHLVVVGSQDERVWLDASVSGSFWIGLSDLAVEGQFRWVTGAPLGTFVQWGSGEPNNDFGTEDCVEYRETTDRWNDRTCSQPNAWACEWDGVPAAPQP